jgi:CheY-like chemotaxis protein
MSSQARILLVDDRPENLLALEAILSSLNQTLIRAGSGEEALKALLTEEYAVILLDVQMPGMDGYETASHIKRREKTRDVPIIFLTAIDTEQQHAFRGYAAGAVDYLAKPFDPWVLRAKVQVFVDLWNKKRQLEEQAALLREQMSSAGAARGSRTELGASGVPLPSSGGVEASGGVRGGAAVATADPAADHTPGNGLIAELSGRLAAVEEQVDLLRSQSRVTVDAAIAESVTQLAQRVDRLRAVLDAISVPRQI